MQLDKPIIHQINIEPVILPVNLLTGANNGAWLSLKNYDRVLFVLIKTAGTAGEDVTLTFRQATAIAGTSAKDLAVVNRVWRKQHATDLPGNWTVTTQTAAATFLNTDSAEQICLYAIEVSAEELDRQNGFDCVTVNIADPGTGTAQTATVLAILCNARYATPLPLDATVD
jgi:hypothetical protein